MNAKYLKSPAMPCDPVSLTRNARKVSASGLKSLGPRSVMYQQSRAGSCLETNKGSDEDPILLLARPEKFELSTPLFAGRFVLARNQINQLLPFDLKTRRDLDHRNCCNTPGDRLPPHRMMTTVRSVNSSAYFRYPANATPAAPSTSQPSSSRS